VPSFPTPNNKGEVVKQIKKRLTYANVMSSIAVFLVLGGATAIAAGLAKNSVGTKQLKKNAVTTAKIKNNAVTTGKIRNGAVTASKLGAGAVGASAIGAGSITGDKLAGGAVGSGQLADGSVTSSKVANGAITREKLADGALLPQAYGFVSASGVTNTNVSVNLPSPTNPLDGVYCFDLPFTPKNAQATVEIDSEPDDFASVSIAGLGSGLEECGIGTDLEVNTFNAAETTQELVDDSFFIVVW
jgi:hypothetical protein